MKKRLLMAVLMFFMCLGLGACSMSGGADTEGPGFIYPSADGDYDTKEEGIIDSSSTGNLGNATGVQIPAGVLTSSVIDDFKDYNYFLSLCLKENQEGEEGIFNHYAEYYYTIGKIYVQNMIKVRVTVGEEVARGAKISLLNTDECYYQTVSNSFGIGYVFVPKEYEGLLTELVVEVQYHNNIKYVNVPIEKQVIVDFEEKESDSNEIDLLFVIDTTGSMGDELEYLKAEIASVIASVKNKCADVDIKLGLLFYRDDETLSPDLYVTRGFDFSSDVELQCYNLKQQYAEGGGDFPEAVEVALAEAVNDFSWREKSTKILIHVLDAPPHSTSADMLIFSSSIKKAAEKGITIIPVASSGVNKLTEYLLRVEAIMTGGKYVFLTDDSGIGNPHITGSTDKPLVVEYLNSALIRLIVEYHTGIESVPQEITKQ